jgi:hypothetical protein
MRYAKTKCKFTVKNGEEIVIHGPYYDDPTRTREVTVKRKDLEALENGSKRFIQDAFPYLSANDREFLISGMSPEGWDETFKEDE